LCRDWSADRSPEVSLQSGSPLVDLRSPSIVLIEVEQDTLVEVVAKKPANIRGIRRRQEITTQDAGPNRIRFGFLQGLALIVAANINFSLPAITRRLDSDIL
jgi:hypothetical protein